MADPGAPPMFPTTCWSRILPGGAGAEEGPADERALETLAQLYWRPIHAYLRCALSRRDDEARDLTQDFFVWMIETGFVAKADPARGRFRAFLKTGLRHYVTDQDRKRLAAKRGGGRRLLPLDGGDETPAPLPLVASDGTPDEILDAAWRSEVVRHAVLGVEQELTAAGRPVVFAVFRDYFLDPDEQTDYRTVAARHGITTSDVSNYLRRAKQLYREHLRVQVAETVSSPEDLTEELGWLLGPGQGKRP